MNEEAQKCLIIKFRKRAMRLRVASGVILFLILASLASSTYLFVSSGNIALRDLTGLKTAFLDNETRPPQIGFEGTNTTGMVFDNYNERIKMLEAKVYGQKDNRTSHIYLVSTVTTKIGSVLILLFLVQILVTLYRYNTRLSAYYDARGDGLELVSKQSVSELEQIIKALSPENIDYGKTPSTPTEQVVDLAKEIAKRQQ